MKKLVFIFAVLALAGVAAFTPPKRSIIGHWMIRYGADQKILLEFRKDGTFKTEIPAENFTVEGQYTFKDDVVGFTDTTCGRNYWGHYKVNFFTADSLYSEVMEDSCMGRKSAGDKATIVRVKQ